MTIRETIVPKALARQRTSAKGAPGAKLRTRRRRSTMHSLATRPNLIHCSMTPSIQVRDTWVRVSEEVGGRPFMAASPGTARRRRQARTALARIRRILG
jgi:hypothetical protein